MDQTIKGILNSALDLKEASIKRAKNTNKSPRFAEVYDIELTELGKARAWVNSQKTA